MSELCYALHRQPEKGEITMFTVAVAYEKEYPDDKLREVQAMYAKTRCDGQECEHFDDFELCDDAMLAWAIDLGWYIESALKEAEELLNCDLYSDFSPRNNFFFVYVNDVVEFIDKRLPAIPTEL